MNNWKYSFSVSKRPHSNNIFGNQNSGKNTAVLTFFWPDTLLEIHSPTWTASISATHTCLLLFKTYVTPAHNVYPWSILEPLNYRKKFAYWWGRKGTALSSSQESITNMWEYGGRENYLQCSLIRPLYPKAMRSEQLNSPMNFVGSQTDKFIRLNYTRAKMFIRSPTILILW